MDAGHWTLDTRQTTSQNAQQASPPHIHVAKSITMASTATSDFGKVRRPLVRAPSRHSSARHYGLNGLQVTEAEANQILAGFANDDHHADKTWSRQFVEKYLIHVRKILSWCPLFLASLVIVCQLLTLSLFW